MASLCHIVSRPVWGITRDPVSKTKQIKPFKQKQTKEVHGLPDSSSGLGRKRVNNMDQCVCILGPEPQKQRALKHNSHQWGAGHP